MRKYYNIHEAEDMIPLLKPKVINLIRLNNAIDFLDSVEIKYDSEFETIKQDLLMDKKFHDYSFRLCKELEKLLKIGVVVRDIEQGVVNFFSLHKGQEIFLCWKLGEYKIDSWHGINDSYDMRKSVSELKKKI